MTDSNYGVYVRIQNADGALFSSSREELAQVLDDLEALGGAEFKAALVQSLTNKLAKIEVAAVPQPQATVTQLPTAVNETEALANVEAVMGATSVVEDAPQQQFEKCEICGGVKDQWKPGGVSKAGKKYSGFWGCGNFRNHPR